MDVRRRLARTPAERLQPTPEARARTCERNAPRVGVAIPDGTNGRTVVSVAISTDNPRAGGSAVAYGVAVRVP
ncbi:MAG TPA: hypothetical protein VIJ58_08800 [Candidatus Dormibacteraeota bacterium]